MFSTDQFKTLANSTVILDDAAAINGTNARLWCYGGSHLILGENCGTLTFTRDATSYVGAEDRGQCDRITILGGALEILPASGKEHFAIGARHEVGVTGIVHLVDGRLTTIRTVMGRRWDEWGDDPCQSYGELIMDGGTFSSDELLVGTMKSGSEYGKGAAVLRFNGGTAVLGKFHTFPLTDRDILFTGTTFKPQADADDFLFAMPCHQSETVAVGEGGLIIDTDGYTVGSNFSPSGSGGLVKRGEGTLTLKADLPCAGLTQVEAGTLTFEGTRSLGGGIEVASGFAPENARVMMAGTLTFADGAKLALTVANGTAGSFSASQYIQEGTLEIVLTAPEAYSGVCALIDDHTGFDVARITVTGLPAGAVTGVAGNRLMLYGAGASVWKGGAGTWADLDGWNGGSWVEGSLARFETAAGSEVTLNGPVNAAGLAFAESASLLSAGTVATLALGDGAIAVPSGRTVVIEAETVPQGGLLKTGLGTLTVDGIQPSLGPIQVEAGTLNVKGTVRNLSSFTAEEGATVRFAVDASVSVAGLATFLGTLSADPDGLATLEAQTIEITPGFIVPAGLELHAQTIPYVTLTNNVDGFTVDGMLVDDDTLMVGYVLNGTGARTGGEEYQIDGTGTLRVKEMRMRSQSVQHFTVNRLEITGAHPYATASWGEMAFDGTTVAAYGQDISADTSDGVTLRLLEGGVTFDTLDAADGMTARTITLADGNGAIIGSGSLTKTGPGTLALAMEQTYTGETWVEGGTLRVARPTSTAGFTVTGTDSALQFEGAVGQVQQVSLGAGTKLVVGDGVASATVAPQALTCAAGTAIELAMGSGGLSGSPFLDLRDATVSFAPDAPPVVQVVLKGEMPDGAYDVIAYAPTDAETLAGCVFSFIDATDAGCTATFENVATEGVVRLHLGGSPVEPVANEWVGRAGGSWNEGLNWAATASPLATLPLVFAGSRGLTNVNDVGMAVYPSLTFAANAGPFDVDLKGAGQGIGVIASAAVDVQVVHNYVNTTDLRKSGTGMVELVDPTLGGKLVLDAGSPIALRASDGNRVTVNSNGGSWSSGPLSYLGPGEFLTSRIYPNSAATPVVFDEGATVWITTHNGAKNGLIVAGGTDRKLLAGRCTIGSRFTDPMTELVRVITVELTDEDEGTTVTTDIVVGTPIIIQTTCNASATSRNQAYITGAGRLRIGGNGSFVFNPQTTFLYTGATEVMPGATAVVKPDVAVQGSPFVVAGTLVLEGGALAMPLSVEAGGTLDMPGTPSLGGVSLVDGSKVRLYVAGNGTVSPIACEVEPPDAGTAQVELECAADLAADTVLILTQGANLTAADASKFTVSCVREGTEVNKRLFQKRDVENGELIAVFKEFGTVILLQ